MGLREGGGVRSTTGNQGPPPQNPPCQSKEEHTQSHTHYVHTQEVRACVRLWVDGCEAGRKIEGKGEKRLKGRGECWLLAAGQEGCGDGGGRERAGEKKQTNKHEFNTRGGKEQAIPKKKSDNSKP